MLLLNVRHMARRPVFSAFNRPQSRKGNLLMYVRKDFHKSTGFIQIMDDALARHPDLEAIVYGGSRTMRMRSAVACCTFRMAAASPSASRICFSRSASARAARRR